ncbi:alcohol dehydrogenase catalytic domain-containing protein [Aneurinibacillus sp. Ricciae_BoGa-3]|uniref:zinc-dependent alcohol dehydrogenase n=1 Tax=Aneurinibacillus sp. Ricciae_BoGa-3 TaxID=3022697 RepID=UPI00233F9FEB|nr:alcohol dehydrogenase catalytic domain-containing protein [Aneurinibacillus sp. Ricciae_BoGa-3]WCK53250.1 alcohol dehydrogenase catalytic domain-containing protein [Aneurinibacillus sp. Ricciae_BoGa-3]
MLELYLTKPGDLQLREGGSVPSPSNEEVKIKVTYGGICGSDLGVFKGSLKHASYPLRPGHELVGTIIEAGQDVKYKVGMRVVIFPNSFCGECEFCLKGKTNICRHKKSIGVNTNGGFSEELVISAKYVLPIPDDMADERAVLIEPFAVVVHALNKVNLAPGMTVAIIGCGNEGMLAAALANHLGARVTAIDINPVKLQRVTTLGDIKAVHPAEITDDTFDVVIEAAGAKNAVEQAVELVRPGGDIVLIGLAQQADLPIVQIVRNEITLHGSIIYTFPHDFQQSIEYLKKKEFNVSPVISKIVPFREYKMAYETAISGDYGKVVLNFKVNE